MDAAELEKCMITGMPVLLGTQKYGIVVAIVVKREPQTVMLMATGNLQGAAAGLQKLSNIVRMQPTELARMFLPPGAILRAKPYDVMPAGGDWGQNPNGILTGIIKQHGSPKQQTIQARTALMVYGAAAEWFRRNMLGGTAFKRVHTGRLVWMDSKESRGSRGIKTDLNAVRGWLAVHRVQAMPGRKLYAVPENHDTPGLLSRSTIYQTALQQYLALSTPVNSKE